MSKNCLVTKLKSVVNNDALPEFNTIKFSLLSSNNSKQTLSRVGSSTGNPVSLSIENGNFYNYESDTPRGQNVDIVGEHSMQFMLTSPCMLRIKNINNLTVLSFFKYSIDDSATATLIADCFDPQYIFNLSDVSFCTNLTYLSMNNDNVGDLSQLGKLTKLSTLSLNGGAVTGQLEDLVKAWISNGRSATGSATIQFNGKNTELFTKSDFTVAFGSMKFVNTVTGGTITWDSSTKMYVILDYTSVVRYIGDYDEAAMTASGQPWEGKTPQKVG